MWDKAGVLALARFLLRCAFVVCVAAALVMSQTTRSVAVQTGAISGVVYDAVTNAPLQGANVTAVAGTGSYQSTTNASGFYLFVGVPPDTYTITVSRNGYQVSVIAGLTVQQGVNFKVDVHLNREAKTLGRVPVKATRATLVQKDVTTDSYAVGVQQQETLKGTPLASEQFGLITQLPGVSNAGGYPLLRGGLENNEGYQIEGITVVDPFFYQFANNDTYNGAQSIKVVLGPGDASQGGAGSGYINSIVKRGTYPTSGILQYEQGVNTLQHNVNFEYGGAAPDNRWSWFLSGRYQPYMAQGGAQGFNGGGPYKPAQTIDNIPLDDQLGALNYTVAGDTLVNVFYRYDSKAADQIQFFDEIGLQNYVGNYGINTNNTLYYAADPLYSFWTSLYAPYQQQMLPLFIGQNPLSPIPNVPGQIQQYELSKLAVSHQFSDATYLNLRFYRLNGNTNFNLTESNYPYLSFGYPFLFGDFFEGTPFQTSGVAFDLNQQAGTKNFITLGGEYKFSNGHLLLQYPVSATFAFLPNEFLDFAAGLGGPFDPTKPGNCCIRMPSAMYGTLDPEYVSNAYISDQIKPNNRLTILPGLRWEQQLIHMPPGTYDVASFQPKLGVSYALGQGGLTVVRATYGHSTVFAPLGQVETIYQTESGFKNYPATASICGGFTANFSQPCANYYDQILNDMAAAIGINPASFPRPQQSDSYDLSVEQELPYQLSVKLTGWYRRDYSVLVNESLPIIVSGSQITGPQQVTNNGFGSSTGVDLAFLRQVSQGLGGSLYFTYINQFINYLSSNAFIPTDLPGTLAAPPVHPPYLSPFTASLALDWRRNGWRVNPNFIYNEGLPQGFSQSYYVLVNGAYNAVPNTNYFGNPNTPCYYVDPQVPGTVTAPNIVGSLGGACSKARNGTLGPQSLFGNITVSKDVSKNSTLGFSIFNLFNNTVIGPYSYYNGASGNFSYVNNGYGAYGAGSGFSQYGPNGLGIPGAPSAFPPGPFFNTESQSGISALLYINYKL